MIIIGWARPHPQETVLRWPFVPLLIACALLAAGCSRPGVAAPGNGNAQGGNTATVIALAPEETPDSPPSPTLAVATATPTPESTRTPTATPPDPTSPPSPTLGPTPSPTRTPALPTATPTALHRAATPAPRPTGTITPRLIYGGNPQHKRIALTLDVEADPKPLLPILETLKEKGVRATFFILGQFAKAHPDLVKRIVDEGHEIGNHSWSHPDFRTLTREQMVEELRKTEETIQKITGQSTKPYFRPPFSYRNKETIQVAGEEGYLTIVWTTETYDWKQGATVRTMVASVLKEAKPGGIVVMHTSKARDAEALPDLIDALRREGYEVVTLSEVLGP
jgi:peptidoglycan/xylan/chitin deacetylase (PgdA/CDA1 family)